MGGIILLILIQPIPKIQAGVPDFSLIGVSEGDTFTYVLEEYQSSLGDYQVAYDYSTQQWLRIKENGEFNVTITNTTIFSASLGYSINATYTNSSFTAESTFYFNLDGWALFTDWSFYEADFTDFFGQQVADGVAEGYNLTNGVNEFEVEVKYSEPALLYDYLYSSFDKTTGMLLYSHQIVTLSPGNIYFAIVRQKGYVLAEDTNSSSNTNSTITSSTESLSTSTISSNTSNATTDSDDGSTSPLPGFGVILSFTTLFTIFTMLKFKKH